MSFMNAPDGVGFDVLLEVAGSQAHNSIASIIVKPLNSRLHQQQECQRCKPTKHHVAQVIQLMLARRVVVASVVLHTFAQ